MRIFGDFNEIKSAVGTEIGASDWLEVSQERINLFHFIGRKRLPHG